MNPKRITFGTCAILIIMVTIKLLSVDTSPPLVDTSDVYTIEGFLTKSEYFISLDPETTDSQSKKVTVAADHIESVNLDGYDEIYSGVFYKKEGATATIRVDLNNQDVRFFVNPPNGTMTVCSYISKYGLQLATNGGGFNADSAIPGPYAMFEGQVYSTEQVSSISLFITDSNEVVFAPDGHVPEGAKYAVSGFNRVVQNGSVLDRFYPGHKNYNPGYGYLKRRTSIGISGNWLNIVLFDSPLTITEVGEYHLATFPGTEHVYNLDGGGSTNACTADYGSLVTESGRPVANIFGIYSSQKR